MFGIFKRGKKKNKGRQGGGIKNFNDIPSRIDLPEPKGEFRNLFAERGMMPKPQGANGGAGQETNAPKSE